MSDIKREGNEVSFELLIPAEEIEKAKQSVYLKEKNHFQMPGFRKGKVPRKLIEQSYGPDIFFEDAINELIPSYYSEFVEKNDVELAGRPNITVKDGYKAGDDAVLEVTVEVIPEFELKDYSKIEVPEIKYEVTDELIDHELEHEREHNKRAVIVEDRASKSGDTLLIDYTGFVDGEEFEGGQASDYELELGSNTFIPGFEDQLVGAEAGKEVEVKVTFPEEYHAEELAGKDAIFDVLVKEIREVEYPEVDDEFIKDISEFDTVDEYREAKRTELQKDLDSRKDAEIKNAVLYKITEFADFEVPKDLVEDSIDKEMNRFAQNLAQYGVDFNDYIESTGEDVELMRDNFRETATINSKIEIIMDKIIKDKNIEASDDEAREELNRVANEYFPDNEESRENFIKSNERNIELIKDDLVFNKALDMLIENVVFVEPVEEELDEKIEEAKEEAETLDPKDAENAEVAEKEEEDK